jgi:hypothetical protein
LGRTWPEQLLHDLRFHLALNATVFALVLDCLADYADEA